MFALRSLSAIAMISAVAAQNVTQIMVGGPSSNPFIFTPPNVTAAVGDIIMFTFSGVPGNHSVTQSSFTDPCDPLASGGFDSGNVLELSAPSTFPTWNLTITNTSEPIWFFCKQLAPEAHCNVGMVGSINAPTSGSNTFEAFQSAAAMHQGNSGQSVGFLVGQGASASAVPGPLTGVVSGFGQPNPTATAPSVAASAASSSGAAATTTTSSAARLDIYSYAVAAVEREKQWLTLTSSACTDVSNHPARLNHEHVSSEVHLQLMNDFLVIVKDLKLPTELMSFILWQPDLHRANMMIREHGLPEILGLLDWQHAWIGPRFLHTLFPPIFRCDQVLIDTVGIKSTPSLPDDFDTLDPYVQDKAREELRMAKREHLYTRAICVYDCPRFLVMRSPLYHLIATLFRQLSDIWPDGASGFLKALL